MFEERDGLVSAEGAFVGVYPHIAFAIASISSREKRLSQ